MKNTKRIIASVLALMLLFTMPAFAGENLKPIVPTEEAKFFTQVSNDLLELYHFDISKDELLERTLINLVNSDPQALDSFLRALFNSLDEYSEFYTPAEYAELNRALENIGGGIGVQMSKGERYIEIIQVISGSAAEKAGVLPGDLIIKVEGEDMSGKSTDYVANKVRGEIGTTVNLTLARGNRIFDLAIVRGELKQDSVSYTILDDGVGYIYIESFTSTTNKDLKKVLTEFDKKKIKKIILDLRYNAGGYLEVAVDVAKNFVPKGVIATHKTKYGNMSTSYRSDLKKSKYKLVTLVNEYTASAAELLASALQDSNASKLIGEQTYGKAVTQSILSLYGGRMCKVTTGEYFTRKGKQINKVGIKPNYVISNEIITLAESDINEMIFAPEYKEGFDGEELYAIKQRLAALGYDVGYFDTPYDEKMKYAVMAFQGDSSLEPTGVLDINTQMFLFDKAAEVEVGIDNQMAKAFELFGLEYTGYLKK